MKGFLILSILSIVFFSCKEEKKEYVSISGQWRCEENSSSSPKVYTIEIERSSANNDRYAIYNFNNEGQEEKIYPYLRNDTLFIENQFIGSAQTSIEGIGIVSADKEIIRFEYSVIKLQETKQVLSTCQHL